MKYIITYERIEVKIAKPSKGMTKADVNKAMSNDREPKTIHEFSDYNEALLAFDKIVAENPPAHPKIYRVASLSFGYVESWELWGSNAEDDEDFDTGETFSIREYDNFAENQEE